MGDEHAGRRADAVDPASAAALGRRADDGAGRPVARRMGRYLLRRLGFALVLVFVVSSAALLLTRIAPGDFTTEQGLDHRRGHARADARGPRPQSAARSFSTSSWLGGAVRFDFGRSLLYSRPVGAIVGERALNTAVLATMALLIATLDRHPAGHLFGHALGAGPIDRARDLGRSASRCRRSSDRSRWCSSPRVPGGCRSAA